MRILFRLPALVIAILVATTSSQFPEFTQQYVQRLGGAVDELHGFVARLDEDARAAGLTREAALAQYEAEGSLFLGRRGKTVITTIRRYERLKRHKLDLEGAGPVARVVRLVGDVEPDIAVRAWQDFRPAVPVTLEGILFAAGGFLLAIAGMAGAGRAVRAIGKRPGGTTRDIS